MLNDGRITRQTILAKVSEEEIFHYYLNLTVDFKRKFKSPFRADEHEGCSFFISDRTGSIMFKDFALAEKPIGCFDAVMTLYKVSYPKSLDIVWHDLVVNRGLQRVEVNAKQIAARETKVVRKVEIKRRKLKKQELDFWSKKGKFDVTSELLATYRTYAVDAYWINGNIVDNCKMTFAHKLNGGFQLYFPERKKGEMRFDNPMHVKYGGTERILEGNYVVITKSNKDSFYLSLFGISNFFVINEAIILNKEFMDSISHFDRIFTLFDNDKTGRHLSWQYRKQYQTIPLFVPEGSDFAEWLDVVEAADVVDTIEQLKYDFSI